MDEGSESLPIASGDDPSASSAPAEGTVQPYSCLPCRRKKKKCDRLYPCRNCRRNGADCVFVPRKASTRQPESAALLERVQYLENIISRMQKQLTPELFKNIPRNDQGSGNFRQEDEASTAEPDDTNTNDEIANLGVELGKLAMEDGRSRYITSNAWASLDDEIEDLSSLLPGRQEEQRESMFFTTNPTSILGFGAPYYNLAQLHPPADQIPAYWAFFKSNCDVLVKVLHIPVIEPLILKATQQLDRISRGLEALMMAIYFNVVISLQPEECLQNFGAEKYFLLTNFKFAAEHAFARAGLLETDEIIILQAFTIFLTGLRIHSNVRMMSTLTTLLVRLATNAGVHRDGVHFKLSAFAAEMRRRLWWAICVLDSRACEDTGYDSTITPKSVDTQVPLNVDDEDLFPGMINFPQPRIGQTEMTFSVVRFESTRVFQQVQCMSAVSDISASTAQRLEKRTKAITNIQTRISEQYLKSLDLSDPLSWYTSAICQIVFTKMWLVAYHPLLRRNDSDGLPPGIRDWLFAESTHIIEIWLRLNEETSVRRWKWLCETYVQWYALAFLLSELCWRDNGEAVTRAWNAVDAGLRLGLSIHYPSCRATKVDSCESIDISQTSCDLYKPLRKLWERAHARRTYAHQLSDTELDNKSNVSSSVVARGQPFGACSMNNDLPELLASPNTFDTANDYNMMDTLVRCEGTMDYSDWLLEDEDFRQYLSDEMNSSSNWPWSIPTSMEEAALGAQTRFENQCAPP